MPDTLHIAGLTVMTHIGIHAWEQKILQQLQIDLTIKTDFSTCHNELANTIDYHKLCQQVTAFIESNSFSLIETVAEQIAERIKEQFNIKQLSVSVSKPHAIKNAKNITVTVHR